MVTLFDIVYMLLLLLDFFLFFVFAWYGIFDKEEYKWLANLYWGFTFGLVLYFVIFYDYGFVPLRN